MKFYCLDEREVWHAAAIAAAAKHGHEGVRIKRGEEVAGPGIGFIRPHAEPKALARNHSDFALMARSLTMIQDEAQVLLYEDKSGQFRAYGDWMPDTWRFVSKAAAMDFVALADFPLVSKADVGASSVNVRILKTKAEAVAHVAQLFGAGVQVNHCSGGAKSMQRGYALLQRFVPHDITWRVNAVGYSRAVFKRFNYIDRAVAQTGNVEPVTELTDEVKSLLHFADRFFEHAGTKWCAIDVLKDGDNWRLLETSLAWPWPSPGACNSAPFFGSDKRWIDLFSVMFDEYEGGAWAI